VFLLGAALCSARRSVRADAVWNFHFGNCLANMKFVECHDVVGDWVTKPTNVAVNKSVDFVLGFPATGAAITGNCTWSYTNKHGSWVAFFSWFVEPFGNENFGLGTLDEIDDAQAGLSTPEPITSTVCGVLAYGQDGINYCIAQTAPPSANCGQWG